jgi:hypothetical protein
MTGMRHLLHNNIVNSKLLRQILVGRRGVGYVGHESYILIIKLLPHHKFVIYWIFLLLVCICLVSALFESFVVSNLFRTDSRRSLNNYFIPPFPSRPYYFFRKTWFSHTIHWRDGTHSSETIGWN